ncbi:MAG: hypothetical protein AAF498_15670 [Pseudomonadota bacterium]
MKRLLLLALLVAPISVPAFALTETEARQCRAMAATFGPKKAEFDEMTMTRDELAAAAEAAGEDWENAEALRGFSPEAAAEADVLKVAYEAARAEFEQTQYAWSAVGRQLNADFAAFNAKCSSED